MTEIKCPCKINLFLDITGKREDGYHLIESAFHTSSLCDIIQIKKTDSFSVSTSGRFKIECKEEDNIVYKVLKYFENELGLKDKYSVNIEKNIPSGAGLGGGSSNAACVMKFLNSKTEKKMSESELENIAVEFGADVPFFVRGGFQWAAGIGQALSPFDYVLDYGIILIYPNIHVSTKTAYETFSASDFDKGGYQKVKRLIQKRDYTFKEFVNMQYNVFEKNVFSMKREIENYKNAIENILREKIRMSGSGSAFYVIYDNKNKMQSDFIKLKNIFSNKLFLYAGNLI